MKLEELKNNLMVVAHDARSNRECLLKVNWWEHQYKWLLTEDGEQSITQYLIDTLGTISVISHFGGGGNVTSHPIDYISLASMREYVKGEKLTQPKSRPEPNLTEQLNARLANTSAIQFRGKRFQKEYSGFPHEWHFASEDKLAKLVILTHPEFRIDYEYREPVYETKQETPRASATEFLDDNVRGSFRLLGLH